MGRGWERSDPCLGCVLVFGVSVGVCQWREGNRASIGRRVSRYCWHKVLIQSRLVWSCHRSVWLVRAHWHTRECRFQCGGASSMACGVMGLGRSTRPDGWLCRRFGACSYWLRPCVHQAVPCVSPRSRAECACLLPLEGMAEFLPDTRHAHLLVARFIGPVLCPALAPRFVVSAQPSSSRRCWLLSPCARTCTCWPVGVCLPSPFACAAPLLYMRLSHQGFHAVSSRRHDGGMHPHHACGRAFEGV